MKYICMAQVDVTDKMRKPLIYLYGKEKADR